MKGVWKPLEHFCVVLRATQHGTSPSKAVNIQIDRIITAYISTLDVDKHTMCSG